MKINVIDYPNLMQEVEIGDKIKMEGYEGEVLDIIEPDNLKVKYLKANKYEKIEVWDKDYIYLAEKKEMAK